MLTPSTLVLTLPYVGFDRENPLAQRHTVDIGPGAVGSCLQLPQKCLGVRRTHSNVFGELRCWWGSASGSPEELFHPSPSPLGILALSEVECPCTHNTGWKETDSPGSEGRNHSPSIRPYGKLWMLLTVWTFDPAAPQLVITVTSQSSLPSW